MRKIKYFTSVIVVCSLLVGKAHAFVWPDLTPLIPFSPQFCPMCIASAIPTYISYAQQIPQIKKDLLSVTDVTKLKQFAKSYVTSLGNTLLTALKARKKKVDFSMTIEECKKQNINIDDEKSIQKGFISLFLEYPSDKPNIMTAYKNKSEQLKMDMALESYIMAVEFSKKLYGQADNTTEAAKVEGQKAQGGGDFSDLGLITQFNYVEECLLAGNQTDDSGVQKISDACRKTGLEDCSGTGGSEEEQEKEDRMCLWRNAVLATRLYEQFMVYNEFLMAMSAQYDAVAAIDNVAFIRSQNDSSYGTTKSDGQKESSIMYDKIKTHLINNKALYDTSVSVYADKTVDDPYQRSEEDEVFSRYEKNLQSADKVIMGDFDKADKVEGLVSPAEDKKDDFEALEIIAQIEENVNQAMNMHNMKQNLPAFKKVFKAYDDADRYHKEVVARLGRAGKCVQNFLSPYYKNAATSWFGKACNYYNSGQVYCHYSPEREALIAENDTRPGEGEYDIVCPDDSTHRCYVSNLTDTRFSTGVVGYLVGLYQAVKDNQATSNVDAYIEVTEEATSENSYTAASTINIVENEGSVSLNQEEETDEDLENESDPYKKAFKKATKDEQKDTNSTIVKRDINDRRKGESSLPSIGSAKSGSAPTDAKEGNDEKDHAKAEEEKLETRKNALLNWAIGAEVAKDISNDLLSSTPTFGTANSRFPLWNDQKKFYDQYVDDKYENIKKYLAYKPFAPNLANTATAINALYPYEDIKDELGEVIKTKEEQRQEAQDAINKFQEQAASVPVSTAVDDTFKQYEAQKNTLRLQFKADVNAKKQLIEDLHKQVDELGQKLSIANRVYNSQQEKLEEKESTYGKSDDGIAIGNDMYAKAGRNVDTSESPQTKSLNESKDNQVKSEQEALVVLNQLDTDPNYNPETLEKNMTYIRDTQIPAVEDQLEKARQDYVLKISDLEEEARLKILELIENEENDTTVQDMVAELATSNHPAALADAAIVCVRQYAQDMVAAAKNTIEEMKNSEELYYSVFADKLLATHNKMIDKIINTKVSDIAGCGVLSELTSLNIANTDEDRERVLKDAVSLYKDICDGVQCKVPDDRYFVGVTYKKDDFRAPKTPLSFTSAPLREVFHFDIEDYGNVDKKVLDADNLDNNQNIIITKESFRESGVDLPDVWKAILADHAYVERDIDLGKLFGNTNGGADGTEVSGDPEKAVIRSGMFPCTKDGKVIDMNKTFTYSVGTPSDAGFYQMPECTKVAFNGNRVLDKESNLDMRAADNDAAGTIDETSELGQILAFIPDKEEAQRATLPIPGLPGHPFIQPTPQWDKIKHRLTFNNIVQRAYKRIEEADKVGEDPNDDYKYNSGNRVFMDKNQLGDYLNFVELEIEVADSMVELNEKVIEVKDSLASVFYETEYQMEEDFSLLKEEDYNKAAEVLKEQKGMYLKMAKDDLSSAYATKDGKPLKSDYIKDKLAKLQHRIDALERDSNEVVNITGEEDLDELDQKILNEGADTSIVNEYETEGGSSYDEQMKKLQEPLCTSYMNRGMASNQTPAQPTKIMTDTASVKQKAVSVEAGIQPVQK